MRVLFLDEEIPLPLNTGKRIRTYNLLKRLASGNDITYIAYMDTIKEKEAIEHLTQLGIEVVAVKKIKLKSTP